MLHYYAVRILVDFWVSRPCCSIASLLKDLGGERITEWVNMGGQLMPAQDVEQLRHDIGSGGLASWEEIHGRYNQLWAAYPCEKQKHAFAVLCMLSGSGTINEKQWRTALDKCVRIQEFVRDQVFVSRKKDDDNTFRKATYRNDDEMNAIVGTADENSFVKQVRKETTVFAKTINTIKKNGLIRKTRQGDGKPCSSIRKNTQSSRSRAK
jgi:hypothetical protein